MSPRATVAVLDGSELIEFSFADLMKYHGPGSPGGVAHAFKVMERAFALLEPGGPPQRRQITVRTAFRGPGARDGFELVTRAVTEGRFTIDPLLERPERGRTHERFVFEVGLGERAVTLLLRDGFVTEEFIDLARTPEPTEEQEARLAMLKRRMAELVMATDAPDVYDVVVPTPDPATLPADVLARHRRAR